MKPDIFVISALFGLLTSSAIAGAEAPDFGWAISIGGPLSDSGHAIGVDAERNVIVAGSIGRELRQNQPRRVPAYVRMSEGFVAKINPEGHVMWLFQTSSSDSASCHRMAVDREGSTYITGNFSGETKFGAISLKNGAAQKYVAKLNPKGEVTWAYPFDDTASNRWTWCLAAAPDDTVYLLAGGNREIELGTNHVAFATNGSSALLHLNRDGSLLSSKSVDAGRTLAGALTCDAKGNLYLGLMFSETTHVAGKEFKSRGGLDILVIKTDSEGNVLWTTQAGGESNYEGGDHIHGLTVDDEGAVYVAGSFADVAYFGNIRLSTAGRCDAFVAKLNPKGEFVWAAKAGGSQHCYAHGIGLDSKRNIYLTGGMQGKPKFGSQTFECQSNDIFVSKLNPKGEFLWTKQAGNKEYNVALGLAVDSEDCVSIVGWFRGAAKFGSKNAESVGEKMMRENPGWLPVPPEALVGSEILARADPSLAVMRARTMTDAFVAKISGPDVKPKK